MERKELLEEIKRWFHALGRPKYKSITTDREAMLEILALEPRAVIYMDNSLIEDEELIQCVLENLQDGDTWILEQIIHPTVEIQDAILERKILNK